MSPAVATITDARRAAADLLADLRSGVLLDAAFDRRTAALEPRDRRWVQELVWTMLRRRGALDHRIAPCVTGGFARIDADVADLLRLGAAQLFQMDSVPAYAAIAQTVELAKRRHGPGAAGLVNAVLRRLDRERDQPAPPLPGDPVEALAVTHSHPRWLVARWVARWGAEATQALLEANNTEAPIHLRPWDCTAAELAAMCAAEGVTTEPALLVDDGVRLPSGTALTALTAFREGRCLVQDPAATLVTRYAAIPAGARVADLCAAPGGKAVELARTVSEVIAADASEAREAGTLGTFDAVLVDAPCTGTGTFRRHPDARWRLKPSDLAVMAATHRAILRGAAEAVAPGGLLIYSTCSLEPEEDDAPVEAFLAEHPEWSLEPPPEGTVPASTLDAGHLRVLPHRHATDGSFAARLRRGVA
ncbi:MAG: transcription antitermination factor NusB [Gemmatimonadota bacterium]